MTSPDLPTPTVPGREATDPFTPQSRHIAVVSGGLGEPSQSTMLAEALAEATADALAEQGVAPQVHMIPLRPLAGDIAQALVTPTRSEPLAEALRQVQTADGVVAVSPTFKASYSGLFKSFVDLLEDGTLTGVPVLLGATGGTARHSLMIDTALRPLFAYLRTQAVPTAVFAASDDWGRAQGQQESLSTTPLRARIADAGRDLATALTLRQPRPRPTTDDPSPLEVTPFDQLLHPAS
ncbi:CE1759 family FMN reductase [Micrococcus sp.]|uniref:CE1759 family FMN reductase n=1 Tax=Micrococcus sp. TaxID=1271 RepID=UPI002A910854|nr:CE1759 family FMN reductase [Micrococcus sp.]MDY6055097.1 CE1759 family FMN reductase [Micrococcus sp.]